VLSSSAVVLDSEDRVLRASSAARAFGLVKGDQLLVGELLALARQVRRDGEIREGEIEVSDHKHGDRTTSFAVRVAPLGAPLGSAAGGGLVLVLAEDQTESRRVEEVRRDFVANVSHELKTPVGALALLAETVEDAADDPEAVRRFAGRMRYEASRLTSLVKDLITLSRIQAAEPVPDPVPVKLDAVVAEALDRCRMKAGARGIDLVETTHKGLEVLGDEDLLVTALRNLLENAVDSARSTPACCCPPGGPPITPSRSASPTRASGSRSGTGSGSSSGSTGWTRRGPARPAAPGSVSPL
jgi:two-component system sensor histidine kinase SenX3